MAGPGGQKDGVGVANMEMDEFGEGRVVECLKLSFQQRRITVDACNKEVASLIAESHVDVNVDPVLHKTCSQDLLSLCRQVPRGQGRRE
jgi:Golgi apparatus protein 1